MVSRTSKPKWGRIAIGLAILPAVSAMENRIWAQTATAPAQFTAVRDAAPPKDADAARQLMKKGRAALQAGDLAKAERMAREAQNMKVALPFWEGDTPEKLMADVANAKAKAIPNADPKALLKLARDAMSAGRFDEAHALGARANGMNAKWGFLEDNPNKFLDDLQKARARAEKAESIQLLADARAAFEHGKLDDAESMAYRAERLHGPYSVWEFGEKPQKLLSDIQTARAKTKKTAGTAVASMPTPEPSWPDEPKSAKSAPARSEIVQASHAEKASNRGKEQAVALMAQGKAEMQAGRMSEARQKFTEAQRACRDFRPEEENPIRCQGELNAAVMRQIREATQANCSASDPAETRSACEAQLLKAQTLAREFGMDSRPIDAKLSALRSESKPAMPSDIGETLIEKARLELNRGQFEVARQLASEAFNGPYSVRNEAAAVIRSIDAAEQSQRSASAQRGFQAGAAAFTSGDFANAHGILLQVDAGQLSAADRQSHQNMLQSCKQKMAASAQPSAPSLIVPASGDEPAFKPAPLPAPPVTAPTPRMIPSTPGSASTPTAAGDDMTNQVKALQKVEFQRLREEALRTESDAKKAFERGETDTALEMLQSFLNKLKSSQLEQRDVALLQRPVETRLSTLKLLKSAKDSETRNGNRKKEFDLEKGRLALVEERKKGQIKDLMRQYNTMLKEGRFKEAQMVAAQARSLEPDDPSLQAAEKVAQISYSQLQHDDGKNNSEKMFTNRLNEVENPGPDVGDSKPLHIDPSVLKTASERGRGTETINLQNKTEAEREIQHKLTMPVDLNFQATPLRQVIDDLKVMTGMNIVPDSTALEDEHINLDQPVTMKVDHLALKSALKLLLNSVRLTYVISDDVLKVTTEKRARGKLVQKVYRVADLVMPIEDYAQPASQSLQRTMDRIVEQQTINLRNGSAPFNNGKFMLGDGQPVSGNQSSMTTAPGQPVPGMSQIGAPTTQKQTQHEMLMKLIQNTISPQSWAEVGGAGTIDFMPIGMALVINQTVDVQEQVQELLDALRRLQDLQVAVEIKLITLSETFFERIGLDFNLNVKTDKNTSKFEPQLTTGQFKPAGQVNDFSPGRMVAGLTPAGSLTSDLDVPIRSSSFEYAIPPFAYPNNPGFNGGLSMGLAFLSDIQVFMFMEAAQGDRRIHVMQAPKLTLFNGQTASINVLDQQFFVTNVGIVGFGGQIVFVPQNNPFPLGAELTMQAVVSADRRFVRMNINQRLSNLASANVPLFPVTTFITPVFEGGSQGQPIPFTQFIQQPQLSLVQIQTTVSVPDGGTVILGGLKTLSEGRNEFGPPVLSKIPYANRLFKNVGFGREAQSLLIMVTPRIIINAEEEVRQTDVDSRPDQ